MTPNSSKSRRRNLKRALRLIIDPKDITGIFLTIFIYFLLVDFPSEFYSDHLIPFYFEKLSSTAFKLLFSGVALWIVYRVTNSFYRKYFNNKPIRSVLVTLTAIVWAEICLNGKEMIALYDSLSFFHVLLVLTALDFSLVSFQVLSLFKIRGFWQKFINHMMTIVKMFGNITQSLLSKLPDLELRGNKHWQFEDLEIAEDEWERRDDANKFGQKIVKKHPPSSYSILISGHWGSGKTYFLRMVKEACEAEYRQFSRAQDLPKPLIIEINPWSFKENQSIGIMIYKSIARELKSIDRELSSQIIELTNTLSGYVGVINRLWNSIFNLERENSERINELIMSRIRILNVKPVIFIDDIDRLGSDEIYDLFKIVRDSFNFPNTYFILAFDKEYVVQGLKKFTEHNTNAFAEKLFDEEYKLPYSDKIDVIGKINHLLEKENIQFKVEEHDDITKFLKMLLVNHRDVDKFEKYLLRLTQNVNVGALDKFDIIGYICLNIKYSQVMNSLFNWRYAFFEWPQISQVGMRSYINLGSRSVKIPDGENQGTQKYKTELKYFVTEYLIESHREFGIRMIEAEVISNMIRMMFVEREPNSLYPSNHSAFGDGIADCDYFYVYFSDFHTKSVYKTELLELIRASSSEEVSDYVTSFKRDEILAALNILLPKVLSDETIDSRRVVSLILLCGGSFEPYKHLNTYINQDDNNLYDSIFREIEDSTATTPSKLNLLSTLITHNHRIKISLSDPKSTFVEKAVKLYGQLYGQLLTDLDELIEIGDFEKMKTIISFHENGWNLNPKNSETPNKIILSDEVNSQLKDHLDLKKENLESFLKYTLFKTNSSESSERRFYAFYVFTPQIFGSWAKFLEFLNKKKKHDSNELFDFYIIMLHKYLDTDSATGIENQVIRKPVKLSEDEIETAKSLGFYTFLEDDITKN